MKPNKQWRVTRIHIWWYLSFVYFSFFFFSFGNGKREVKGPMRYMEERNVKLNEITCFAGLWACFFQNLERKKERLLVVTKERLVFKKRLRIILQFFLGKIKLYVFVYVMYEILKWHIIYRFGEASSLQNISNLKII